MNYLNHMLTELFHSAYAKMKGLYVIHTGYNANEEGNGAMKI